jgi:hypothetical protein
LLTRQGWRRALLPPLVAFLVANAVLGAAAVAGGFDPLSAHRWSSFDSPIYLSIAQHGYTEWSCPQWELDQGATACGTFGWFPLYAAPVRALIEVGLSPDASGVVVALVFWLGLLIVLWNGLILARGAHARGGLPARHLPDVDGDLLPAPRPAGAAA